MGKVAAKKPTAGNAPARGRRRSPAPARSRGGKARAASNGKKLVIVESPAKARTINRYLGGDYLVKACMGHVRDLPPKQFGVDLDNDFAPTYEPLPGRRKVLAELKKHARAAKEVYLATDLDREGEAIAWHLAEALKVPPERLRRVIFNEITRPAIREAFANPGRIDPKKVDAQQARRILDRIVGYQLSPLLWRKVARGLSAGRVQSVAVRMIVDREREIAAFVPEEFWKISAILTPDLQAAEDLERQWEAFCAQPTPPSQADQLAFLAQHGAFRAELVEWKGERFRCGDHAAAAEVAAGLGLKIESVLREEDPRGKGPARHRVRILGRMRRPGEAEFTVESVQARTSRTRPPGPFTTATLQQAAAIRLRFGAARTMRIAQRLYEGVELGAEGSVGLITYMRTDSQNLSPQAVSQVRDFIGEHFGAEYLPEKPNVYRSSARAQAAHEAIRPTDVTRTPESLRGRLEADLLRLYELIWRRFVACQMPPAEWDVTEVGVAGRCPQGRALLRAMGRRLRFDGYLKVAGMPRSQEQMLPALEAHQPLAPVKIEPTQHFTQPPPRYTEASLVKALEAEGIGRPSTYASIIQTIQDRDYVKQIDRRFHATPLGMKVTDKLVQHFPDVFDLRFTARLEDRLDEIEDARADWVQVLRDFYGPFKSDLERAGEEMVHAKAETEPSDYTCPQCGKPMVYRWSKSGRYLACTGWPECKTTFPVDAEGRKLQQTRVDIACPKCGAVMVLRRGRYGPFLSCSRYPDCDGLVNLDRRGRVKLPAAPPLEVDLTCPKCGKPLYLRRSARGPWLSCSGFPRCRGRLGWKSLSPEQRAELERKLAAHERAHPQPVIRRTDGSPVPAGYTPRAQEEQSSGEDDSGQGAPEQ